MMLFGCYRRGDANDPDTYVAAIAAVLVRYDADLMREVTDPNTGIQTTDKFESFMPNAGELKRYCEAEAARRARLEHLGSLPVPKRAEVFLPPPEPRPGDLANVFVPADNKRYSALVAWSRDPATNPRLWRIDDRRPGIWISYDIWDSRQTVARRRPEPEEPRSMQLSAAVRKAMGLDAPVASEPAA